MNKNNPPCPRCGRQNNNEYFGAECRNVEACKRRRLHAAAPDLLEAVKDALEAYRENAMKTGRHYDNRAGTIGLEGVLESAIAKAEGR